MYSKKEIFGKKKNDVDNDNICKDNLNAKKTFSSTQDCTEFQIDKKHVFPFPENVWKYILRNQMWSEAEYRC